MADVIMRVGSGVGELILNRPRRRNALVGPLVAELQAGLDVYVADDDVHVILIRGEGGFFCSGLDLDAFSQVPEPAWKARFGEDWRNFHISVAQCPKVVVGALERYAINGGAALALACDLLVVGEQAFLQVGEIQQGMGAPMNLAWLMARFGGHLTRLLALSGERVHGPRLAQLGLAHSCVPDAEVLAAARDLAERLAGYPPGGARHIKRTIAALSGWADDGDGARHWFERAAAVGRGAGNVPPVRVR